MKRFIAVLMSLLLILSFAGCKNKKNKAKNSDSGKPDTSDVSGSSEIPDSNNTSSAAESETVSDLKDGIETLNSAEITVEKNSEAAESKQPAAPEKTEQTQPSSNESSQSKDSEPSNDDGYYKGYY